MSGLAFWAGEAQKVWEFFTTPSPPKLSSEQAVLTSPIPTGLADIQMLAGRELGLCISGKLPGDLDATDLDCFSTSHFQTWPVVP